MTKRYLSILCIGLTLAAPCWAQVPLKQSTAVTLKIGQFVDDTDAKTAETALTISQADVQLSKNGGTLAQKNDASSATHDALGVYGVPLNSTDTGTLGTLELFISESGALPVRRSYVVLPANVWDSLYGSDKLEVDVAQYGGTNGTFASGRPEVNTTHAAGTAWNSGGITTGTFSAGAIDAAAVAASAALEIADADPRLIFSGTADSNSGTSLALNSGTLATGREGDEVMVWVSRPSNGNKYTRGAVIASNTLLTLDAELGFTVVDGEDLVRVYLVPQQLRSIPIPFPGANGGLPTVNGSNYIAGVQGTTLVSTTITVTDQTHFTLAAGPDFDNALNSQTIVLEDASNNNYPSVRTVTAYAGTTKTVTIDSAPAFTIVTGDGAKLLATNPASTAPTTSQIVTAMEANGTKLDGIYDKVPSKTYLAGTNNSDGDLQADEFTGTETFNEIWASSDAEADVAAVPANTRTELTTELARIDAAVTTRASSSSLTTTNATVNTINTATGTTIPAILGTPSGASLAEDIANVEGGGGGGESKALLKETTIAGLTSQTVFTLADGSTDNDAYKKEKGVYFIVIDASDPDQQSVVTANSYVGSTRTVTLKSAPVFTVAPGDTVRVMSAGYTPEPRNIVIEAGGN